MADNYFTLYYFPLSYYSQKVLLVLFEKGKTFNEKIVFIQFGEQHENWFRRINPNGLVPALQDGDKMVVESEEIINYVDKMCPGASPLVPPLDTKLGIEVQKYRQMLDSVKVPQISFGLWKNANLSIKGLQIPAGMKQGFNKQYIEKKMRNDAKEFRKKAGNAKTEEDRQYFEQKATAIEDRAAATSDVVAMERVLKETETIFDELEEQLQRMKQNSTSGDYWLCGVTYTAADITATTLLLRFRLLGIDDRFFGPNRPLCCQYKDRLLARQTTKKLTETADRTYTLMRNRMIKTVAKRVVKVGVLVGLVGVGVFVYRKYFR